MEALSLSPIERIEHYHKLANEHAKEDPLKAIAIAELAIDQSHALLNDTLLIKSYLIAGDITVQTTNNSFTDSMFSLAANRAQKSQHIALLLKAKDNLSRSLARQGRWDEAQSLVDEIIETSESMGDSLTLARAIMTKGIHFEKQSQFDKALAQYYLSLALHEARGDQFRVGIVRSNIGLTLQRLRRYPEALVEFEKAIAIAKMEKDTEGIMIYTLNIGVIHQKRKEFDKATTAFHKALEIAKSLDSWYDIALLTANLGTVAMQQGNYNEALPLLKRAYVIKDSIGEYHDLAHTTNSIAEVHYHRKEYSASAAAAKEAKRLSMKYSRRDQLSESHRLLSLIYAAQQNYALAFTHLQQHKAISDSIFSAESDQVISQLHIQHETNLKAAQIEDLTARNQRSKRDKLIYLAIAVLLLISGAAIIYALYLRRSRDRILLANERILHDRQNQFFTNISHEFRTPLTLILGPLHQLRNAFRGSPEDNVLRTIQQNAQRLLSLINQILDIAKFDMKVLELKKESFDATLMLQGIASSFDSMAQSRDIDYNYHIEPGLVLHADKHRLEIVMSNLISNAFKFTPDHGRITVRAEKETASPILRIQVLDTGSGIPEENLSKVFDRYYHDDRDAHSDYEGAGIGLALSKLIIDMHGGSIAVKSKVHDGTAFTITIPIGTVDAIAHKEAINVYTSNDEETHQPVTVSGNPDDHSPILLLVEDRKDMRDYIASILESHYEVITSSNADDGWKQATTRIPDIIISDVMMPGKNGLEFCSELKKDIRTSHIPVMLLTAKSSPEDRLSGLETAADVYLTKPFIPQELELHVRNLIASRNKLKDFYSRHRRIEPANMSFNSVDEQFLQQFVRHLEAHFSQESFNVEQLADLMNLSRSQIHRKLTALTGQAPNRLIRTYRLKRAYDMVSQHAASISEIAYAVGFGSPAYFIKCFAEEFGVTPGEVRNRVTT